MKFKNYLKIAGIYFILDLAIAVISIIVVFLGAKGIYEMIKCFSDISTVDLLLKFLCELLDRINYSIKCILTSLVSLYIIFNFPKLYVIIKKYLNKKND